MVFFLFNGFAMKKYPIKAQLEEDPFPTLPVWLLADLRSLMAAASNINPLPPGLSKGLLTAWQLTFPREWNHRENPKMKLQCFFLFFELLKIVDMYIYNCKCMIQWH